MDNGETNDLAAASSTMNWIALALKIYEQGPEVLDKNKNLSRRIVARSYQHLVDNEYPYLDQLDDAMERNGFSSRRRFYRVQKDFSGRLVLVLPVDFLKKEKGDRVRVEFIHSDDGKTISLR